MTSTPEEVFLDFGVNMQPFADAPEAVDIIQRVALNYYTAKRMLGALQLAIKRHEEAFGRLETEVRKRVGRASPG